MSRAAALAAQALALIAAGLVLIVAAITAPAPPAPELRFELRPATEQERRDYERQRLADALEELRQQREGVTALNQP